MGQPPPDSPTADRPQRPDPLSETLERVYVIDINRPIDGLFDWYLNNRLTRARNHQADLVLIRLTTPGGDLELSLSAARKLREIDWATIAIWIPEEAISGGAIMALGADVVYMRKSAILGDAGPIMFGPGGQFVHAEEKIVSYTSTAVRELATSSGRPAAIAEAMVNRKLKVYPATDKTTGQTSFLTEQETQRDEVRERFDIGDAIPEAGHDLFLTVGAERAQQLELCDAVFESETELLKQLTSQPITTTTLDWKDTLVYILNRPWFTGLLLIMGLIGLYWEITSPGLGLPGVVAIACFGIFFWSHFLGGTAGWLEVTLFALGVGLLLLELFVVPGFGVFGISGLAMIALALVMATQDVLVPSTQEQWRQFQVNGLSVLTAFAILATIIVVQVMVFDTIPGLKRFQLQPEEVQGTTNSPVETLYDGLNIGQRGVSQSDLRPSGKVAFGEKILDVLTEGDYVERGTEVYILRIEGNIVTVRRC
ncbi:MAG: hypothetical protein KF752_03295 [Pirellulaceae bacterium]|nr:hypothetical protein [Pirellulaceae bacterium]